eukprot:TRINITY_DN7536_c0_g1_i2.p1 TRINITY_DN7536_c0_g1~~TRINITY_DN7536_c0_g1_i2.p1  ORF type:complete len:177 (+),score=21.25 TRINITY_DN7536_c0_g1_i2:197-727(+)
MKETPLHGAAFKNHSEIINLLFQWNGNLFLRNMYKKTPYDIALENGHSCRALLQTLMDSPQGKTQQERADPRKTQKDSSGKVIIHTLDSNNSYSQNDSKNNAGIVTKWTPQEVASWMSRIRLSRDYTSLIVDNAVDGEVLVDMTRTQDWRDLGISIFGDVRKLLKRRRELISLKTQ